jgi:hypothetical protein
VEVGERFGAREFGMDEALDGGAIHRPPLTWAGLEDSPDRSSGIAP